MLRNLVKDQANILGNGSGDKISMKRTSPPEPVPGLRQPHRPKAVAGIVIDEAVLNPSRLVVVVHLDFHGTVMVQMETLAVPDVDVVMSVGIGVVVGTAVLVFVVIDVHEVVTIAEVKVVTMLIVMMSGPRVGIAFVMMVRVNALHALTSSLSGLKSPSFSRNRERSKQPNSQGTIVLSSSIKVRRQHCSSEETSCQCISILKQIRVKDFLILRSNTAIRIKISCRTHPHMLACFRTKV